MVARLIGSLATTEPLAEVFSDSSGDALCSGLQRELEPCDLKELLLQTAIYAGVPAANTGFQIAQKELEGAELQPPKEPKK